MNSYWIESFPNILKNSKELTENINVWFEIDTSQMILSSVFGGVLYGFGTGMVFKAGFTTGGTDILNQIVSKYGKMNIGTSYLLMHFLHH